MPKLRPPFDARSTLGQTLVLAKQLHQRGQLQDAAIHYQSVLKAQPRHGDAKYFFGLLRLQQGRAEDALQLFDGALKIDPRATAAWSSRGVVLGMLGRIEEAVRSFDRALAIKPDLADAHYNRGRALFQLGRLEQALASYDKAHALRPEVPDFLNNRGNTLLSLKRPREALESFAKAIATAPDFADAAFNAGIASLLLGDLAAGWAGYEHRLTLEPVSTSQELVASIPRWTGEEIRGKRIVVAEEQGLGDTIQFLRYLPRLAAAGADVTFLVRRSLHRLLATMPAGVRLTERPGSGDAFDVQCPLLSLPHAFKTTLETIPAAVPYLAAEEKAVAHWRQRIGAAGFKIGIAWQGNPKSAADAGRSVPLRAFAPLAALPGVRLISLQKNDGLDQLAGLPAGLSVEVPDGVDSGPDAFVDTAAVMACMDLVVTSDTSIAHLAGALGRPVWVLLKHVPDWRWMLDRGDSPWYPTMALYRQSVRDRWDDVLVRVARDVARTQTAVADPQPATPLMLPGSPGELCDKITILEVKADRIRDAAKLANVRRELELLREVERGLPWRDGHAALVAELKRTNETLWDIEDDIRDCERRQDFGPAFIALARAVYKTNDRRAALKKEINLLSGSAIVEEKSYAPTT